METSAELCLWLVPTVGIVALAWLVDHAYRAALERGDTESWLRRAIESVMQAITGSSSAAVWLPDRERGTLYRTALEAFVQARAGKVADGYERLLAGRRRALEFASSGEPWAGELMRWYQVMLNRYTTRYGSG